MKGLEERFAYLFRGYDKAFTTLKLDDSNKRIEDRGDKGKKVVGKNKTESSTLALIQYAEHLAGRKYGIGVIPLTEDQTVYFAGIDIDKYTFEDKGLFDLDLQIREKQLPLIVCRTKSGGAHLFLFSRQPLTPSLAAAAMEDFAARLGYGKDREIFPKQFTRVIDPTTNRKDIGSAINLPYYKHLETNRYAVYNHKKLTLEEFLAISETLMIEDETQLKGLMQKASENTEELFKDGPPCLRYLASTSGFPDGCRNKGLYNVAVYLKLAHPNEWKDRLEEYNEKLCKPKLTFDERMTLTNSVSKKDYNYTCREDPIVSYCSRDLCRKQKFGISAVNNNDIDMGLEVRSLTQYEGDPSYWVIDIEDKRMMLTTEELTNQAAFNRKCIEKLRKVPGTMPRAKWEKYLKEMMQKVIVIQAPEDASPFGKFKNLLEKYCYGNLRAMHLAEIKDGKPFFEEVKEAKTENLDGFPIEPRYKVLFKPAGLYDYLTKQGYKYDEHRLWLYLEEHFNAERGSRRIPKSKNETVRVWIIEDFEPTKRRDVKDDEASLEIIEEVF